MIEIITKVVELLNDPLVRAATVLLSFVSLGISMWAFRRTSQALLVHERNIKAEHARYLDEQWQAIDRLTVSDPACALLVAEMFGLEDSNAAKKEAVHLMFLNTLAASFSGLKNNVVSGEVCASHFCSFFSNYAGSYDYLQVVIEDNYKGYDDFKDECLKYMKHGSAPRMIGSPVQN
jgi:hypothetical protein